MMPSPLPRSHLAQQAIRRILATLVLVMIFLGLASGWMQKTASNKEAMSEMAGLHQFYQERMMDLEQGWESHAVKLRTELEYWRLLEHADSRWVELRSFFTVRGDENIFQAVLVVDPKGRILFQHAQGDLFPGGQFVVEANSGWHFDAAHTTLYRYYVQDVWLGKEGDGHLILFRPMDNALLYQNSFPGATLALVWDNHTVANSRGSSGAVLTPEANGIHHHGDSLDIQESLPWGCAAAQVPTLIIHKRIEQFFSNRELLGAWLAAFAVMMIFLYLAVGSWLLRVTRRVTLLGQISREFTSHNQLTPTMMAALDEIRRVSPDEITAVAQAQKELALTIVQRELERQAHESMLQESEARLREITSVIADGVFVIDAQGALTFLNPQGERLLGWREEELLGRNSHAAFHHLRPDGRVNPVEGCPIHQTVNTGKPYRSFEDYYVRRDGSFLPVSLASAPIVREGVVMGAVITFQDNSDRILAEKHVKESEERFRRLFNSARDAVFVIAMQPEGVFGNFLEVNDAACERYGYPREEMLRLTPAVINPPEGQQDLSGLAQRLLETRRATFERIHLARDGRRIPVEVNSQLFEFQGQMAVLSMVRDVTDRKRAEDAMRENEERFRALAHSLRDAILVFDAKGTIDFINRGGERMFGHGERALLDHPVAMLFPHRSHHGIPWANKLHLFDDHTREGFALTMEGAALRSTGEEFPVEISLTAWNRRGEQLYSAAIRDISERRLLEQRDLRAYVNRIAISALLEVGLEPLTLNHKLGVALDIILTVPWLALQSKGSIMLVTPEGDLEMAVERNLSGPLLEKCKRIPFGYCLCGRAAQTRELLFTGQMDNRHDVTFEGIQPHGHYCLPIISREELLGVLNLYVDAGHTHDLEEDAFLTTIANTLAGLIERGRVEEKVQHMASHDALTGLPNRVLFHEHLEQELRHAIRTKRALSVAFLDLDRFKQVNDTLGHEAGDLLLKTVALRLRQCLRESDTLARLGGDEFTLILPAIDSPANAATVAEKIIHALEEPILVFGTPCQIGVSIGLSFYPDHGNQAEELLQKADQAMYAVKNSGRNAFAFYQDLSVLQEAREKEKGGTTRKKRG